MDISKADDSSKTGIAFFFFPPQVEMCLSYCKY